MSKFNIINKLKDNFQENLNGFKNMFKESKSALRDFDEYMSNSPKLVLGIAATSIMAVGALAYDTFKYEFEKKVELDMYKSVADVKFRTNQITDDFLRVPVEAATIRNIKYSENAYALNNATNEVIKLSQPDQPHIFKNPFWANNIISVYNRPNADSKYHPEPLRNTAVDRSNHIIDMDYNQTQIIAKKMKVPEDNQYLVDTYVLFHEAAHASYSQSIPYAGKTTNSIDNELKSDISSLTLIGHNRKEDFDYLIDKVIKLRIESVSPNGNMEGYSHNTGYGLIELKKAIQKNPLILDIEPENISQFSDMFVKELKSINLSTHHENSLKEMKYPTPKEVEHDIYYENKNSMYSSIIYHQIYEGMENNKYNRLKLPPLSESYATSDQIEKASVDISNRLKTHLRYDTLTSIVLENSKNADEAIKKLKDMVDTKPALKNDFITAIAKGNLIYMDELKVNIEPVKKVEEEAQKEKIRQLEQKNENALKRKVELQKPTMNNNAPT